ncbi:MAG: sulfite exporter TauE/SafE family protein [Ilumatobacteraceae bacterium]
MDDLSLLAHVAAAGAAVGAGAVNAIAGGGTLISFPVLTAIGVPATNANATNTVALCPGYIGGTHALRRELAATGEPLQARLIVSAVGGVAGAAALLLTSDDAFRAVVPYLILLSCLLLAVQDRVRSWLDRRGPSGGRLPLIELAGLFLAAVYGGYFGAGLGIMLIAVLGLFSAMPFNHLNAVKQPLAAAINLAAAAFLVFSGRIEWSLVVVMAPSSLVGGQLGGRMSRRLDPHRFRWFVVAIGVVVALVYLVR